ncbi:hypothetical protein V2A60_008733 [Cordyceps javanica]
MFCFCASGVPYLEQKHTAPLWKYTSPPWSLKGHGQIGTLSCDYSLTCAGCETINSEEAINILPTVSKKQLQLVREDDTDTDTEKEDE